MQPGSLPDGSVVEEELSVDIGEECSVFIEFLEAVTIWPLQIIKFDSSASLHCCSS